MKDKNLKYIAHAIIVVVKPPFFGCYYSFSCINLGET